MMRSATSLAVTCAASLPSRRINMDFGRRSAITCVARMCASSLVPQPKASAPRPPTVLAWLSGTAWVAHRLEKGRTRGIGGVVAAGLGGDGMVLHGEGQVRPAHVPVLLLQLFEGV